MADRKQRAAEMGLELLDADAFLARFRNNETAMRQAQVLSEKAGYTTLAYKFDVAFFTLLEGLKKAGIDTIYTNESVKAYKEREQEARNPSAPRIRHGERARFNKFAGIAFCGVTTVAVLTLALLFQNWWVLVGLLVPFVGGCVFAGRFERHQSAFYRISGPYWRSEELKNYHSEIPKDIADRAVRVLEALPEAVLRVEFLDGTRDPFLVVWFQNRQLVIGVWDESRYEAEVLG